MRKLLITAIAAVLLCSCTPKQQASDDMAKFSPSLDASAASVTTTAAPDTSAFVFDGDYLNITDMSTTMVFAQLQNITYNPDSYEGVTLRMRGQFTSVFIPEDDAQYFACYVLDDTGCCTEGFEFTADGLTYPDDYPEEGEFITVEGVITLYEKDGQLYRKLSNAKIELDR